MKTKTADLLVTSYQPGLLKTEHFVGPPTNDWMPLAEAPNHGDAVNGRYESITYATCKKDANGFRPTMSCDHLKATSSAKRWSRSEKLLNRNGTRYSLISGGYTVTDKTFLTTCPTLPDLNPYHVAAMDYFRSGCVKKEADIPVSMIEIGQVRQIIPQLREILSLDRFVGPGSNWRAVKHYMKKAANLHLLSIFGIAPLISDAVAIFQNVKALEGKIKFLRENSQKPIKVEYRSSVPLGTRPNVVCSYSEAAWETIYTEYSLHYKAFAILTYDVSELRDAEIALRSLTRGLGFDNVLGGAWELIPFSFIIDSLLRIDRVLASISPTISLPVVFKDLGYSVLVKKAWDHRWVHFRDLNGDKAIGESTQSCTQTFYRRRPGLPISFTGIDPSLPSTAQLWSDLSLFIQRMK